MTSTRLLISTLLTFIGLLAACDNQSPDRRAIEAVWASWDRVNLNRDGEGAAKLYSSSTLEHYARVLKLGLDAKPDELARLTPMELREIATMRNRATREDLEKLDGRGYARFAAASGWYDIDSGGDAKLGPIKITGDIAGADVRFDGRKAWRVQFVREGGEWKLDETTMYDFSSQAYRDEAKEAGLSLQDYFEALEEDETGQPVSKDLWQPMKRGKRK